MSNENQEQDPVEELFRQKAEEYDIAYNEADWLKLEKRLDSQLRQRKQRNRRIWLTAASILLFSLLGYFTYNNYQAINRLNEQLSEGSTSSVQERSATNESDAGNTINPPNPYSTSPVVGSDSTNHETQQNQGQSTSTSQEAIAEVDEQSEAPLNEPSGATATATPSENEFLAAQRRSDKLLVSNYSCDGCTLSQVGDNILALTQLRRAESPGSTEPTFFANSSEESPLASLQNQRAVRRSSPFAIGIAAGPDLSTVGSLSDFSSPGYKMGIAVEYRVSKNLAVSTGVGRADVRYSADGEEYSPPYGYWTNGNVADKTRARCAILEIPINLKYNFLHFESSRIFASAGVSSYIMLNEEYRFSYEEYGSGLKQNWSDRTGTRHWLSTASLSLGYEFDVLQKWSFRVEPFINLPLKEVGWGNVELYSTGTLVSLNYNL